MPFLFQPTPTHGPPLLNKDLIYRDGTPEPRMPAIADFSKFSIVGVELSTSACSRAHILRSTRRRRTRARSHRRQPVALLPFPKLAVCITVTTASPRSRCAALIPATTDLTTVRSTHLCCAELPPMSVISESTVGRTARTARAVLHTSKWSAVFSFDYSVGTGR